MKSPANWSQILAIFAMIQRYSSGESVGSALSLAGKALTKEIADVKTPVVGGVTQIASSQCSNVKKLLGVDYEQIEEHKEPDLNGLTLEFICPQVRLNFNLSSVARLLPASGGYEPRDKLVLFMHGFTDNPEKTNFAMINEAFRNIGHTNVLALDASSLIQFLYLRSSTYVQFIGEKLGECLAAMVNNGLEPKDIHLIGHSLGAHISAFAGKRFKQLTGLNVGRLSGLDPAGPCFSNVDENLRLKKTDADFVDVIHTDAGVYGIKDTVGHIDYFPNGGSQQPECFFESCSHSRAVEIFAESISRRDAFPARRCKDWDSFKKGCCHDDHSFMGLNSTSADAHGKYYLQTNGTKPFGLGEEGLTYKNTDGVVKSAGNFVSNLFG